MKIDTLAIRRTYGIDVTIAVCQHENEKKPNIAVRRSWAYIYREFLIRYICPFSLLLFSSFVCYVFFFHFIPYFNSPYHASILSALLNYQNHYFQLASIRFDYTDHIICLNSFFQMNQFRRLSSCVIKE